MCNTKFIKRKELAKLLNINAMTLWKLIKRDNDFPVNYIGNKILFDKNQVLNYLSNRYVIEDFTNIISLIDIKESAKILRVSDTVMRRLAKDDIDLQYFRVGRLYRFSKENLIKYVNNKIYRSSKNG
jgi:excisionase family DNA binding protein